MPESSGYCLRIGVSLYGQDTLGKYTPAQLEQETIAETACCLMCSGWLQMSDPYFEAIREEWSNIRALYLTFGSKKPIICMISKRRKYMLIHIWNSRKS